MRAVVALVVVIMAGCASKASPSQPQSFDVALDMRVVNESGSLVVHELVHGTSIGDEATFNRVFNASALIVSQFNSTRSCLDDQLKRWAGPTEVRALNLLSNWNIALNSTTRDALFELGQRNAEGTFDHVKDGGTYVYEVTSDSWWDGCFPYGDGREGTVMHGNNTPFWFTLPDVRP